MHVQFFQQNICSKLNFICHCSHGNFEIMLVTLYNFNLLYQRARTGHADEGHADLNLQF